MDVEVVDSVPERPSSDSEMEVVWVEPKTGPSKPRKRARGRPRKDGTGPFRSPSPTNEQLVDQAFEGEVPPLRKVDLVPVADKPAGWEETPR